MGWWGGGGRWGVGVMGSGWCGGWCVCGRSGELVVLGWMVGWVLCLCLGWWGEKCLWVVCSGGVGDVFVVVGFAGEEWGGWGVVVLGGFV